MPYVLVELEGGCEVTVLGRLHHEAADVGPREVLLELFPSAMDDAYRIIQQVLIVLPHRLPGLRRRAQGQFDTVNPGDRPDEFVHAVVLTDVADVEER